MNDQILYRGIFGVSSYEGELMGDGSYGFVLALPVRQQIHPQVYVSFGFA